MVAVRDVERVMQEGDRCEHAHRILGMLLDQRVDIHDLMLARTEHMTTDVDRFLRSVDDLGHG